MRRERCFDGIRIWSERKKTLSHEDVKQRAIQALKIRSLSRFAVCSFTRVDITDPDLVALKALIEVREEVKPLMTLQLVAFPQEGVLSFPGGKELMIKVLSLKDALVHSRT